MGRIMLVGSSVNGSAEYTLLDMLHYSASGVRDFTQSTARYFSINGGVTNLGNFNTIAGGDLGDWASSVTHDSFDAYATPGVLETISSPDMTEMNALGWTLTGSTTRTAPTDVSIAAETSALASAQATNGLVP